MGKKWDNFQHLDESAYWREICSFTEQRLKQEHKTLQQNIVSSSAAAGASAAGAFFTMGFSLVGTAIAARRYNVNCRQCTLVEKRLKEMEWTGHKFRKRDFAYAAGPCAVAEVVLPAGGALLGHAGQMAVTHAAHHAVGAVGTHAVGAAQQHVVQSITQHAAKDLVTQHTSHAIGTVATHTGAFTHGAVQGVESEVSKVTLGLVGHSAGHVGAVVPVDLATSQASMLGAAAGQMAAGEGGNKLASYMVKQSTKLAVEKTLMKDDGKEVVVSAVEEKTEVVVIEEPIVHENPNIEIARGDRVKEEVEDEDPFENRVESKRLGVLFNDNFIEENPWLRLSPLPEETRKPRGEFVKRENGPVADELNRKVGIIVVKNKLVEENSWLRASPLPETTRVARGDRIKDDDYDPFSYLVPKKKSIVIVEKELIEEKSKLRTNPLPDKSVGKKLSKTGPVHNKKVTISRPPVPLKDKGVPKLPSLSKDREIPRPPIPSKDRDIPMPPTDAIPEKTAEAPKPRKDSVLSNDEDLMEYETQLVWETMTVTERKAKRSTQVSCWVCYMLFGTVSIPSQTYRVAHTDHGGFHSKKVLKRTGKSYRIESGISSGNKDDETKDFTFT